MDEIIITKHASKRLQQRAIKRDWIYQVIRWGQEKYEKGGFYKYFLGKKQLERAKNMGLNIRHCLGLTVVVGVQEQAETLVTVYWGTSSSRGTIGRK